MHIAASDDQPLLTLFPDNAESKLEFDIIKSSLVQNCISELGQNFTLNNSFSADKKQIIQRLLEVKEFQQIISQNISFPTQHYHNLQDLLKMIELPDYSILTNDALLLSQFINATEDVIVFLKKFKDQFTNLHFLQKDIEFKKELKHKLFTIIDLDGNIKSTASDKLFNLRINIASIEYDIDRNFEKILNYCKSREWLAEESESVRNGERVLAFHSKYKRKIKGIIYDESMTGKTTFIQPESILDMRNKWFDLKQKEKREIFIILKDLTRFIRPYIPYITGYQEFMTYMDHTRAKALYSNSIGASMPLISSEACISVKRGYHPVLLTKNKASGRKTIPLDFDLDENNRIMVLSGPNAGGKSVCLKTAGLFQLMIQYGLPVPADDHSVIGIFNKLFVDIGDDQSIENDLSTYSSRLMNQYYFIKNAHDKTLFLIDEFGSGTEPAIGGIIAEVILEALNNAKSRGIVTTHYTNLKVLAGKTKGLINGAMLFDANKLQPLFKLKTGEPGNSFALEILENIGYDRKLISSIKDRMQKDELDLNNLLLDLQLKKENTDTLLNKLQIKENELNKLLEENLNIKSELKSKKNLILTKSFEDAEAYLININKEFEKMVREWKEAKAALKDEKAKSIRKEIQLKRDQLSRSKIILQQESIVKSEISLNMGDDVILKETGQKGSILRIKKDKALVLFGNLKTEIELTKLERTEKQVIKSSKKTISSAIYSIKQEAFNPVLDIRGFRRDNAIREVEIYLDKAILHNFNQLKIIHGYGDGILKEAIRSLLKKYSFIKNFHGENPDHGGDGVTIIEL